MEMIDDETDECLKQKTRKEQNAAFAEITDINDVIPIRMSEITAVFKYTGDISSVGTGEISSVWKKKKALIIKRVILKPDNGSEEEEISLHMKNPNIMRTYLTHRTQFKNYENKIQNILWLIMEPLKQKINMRYVDGDEDTIRAIVTDVLHGLVYMHSNGIAHLDLKLANVMGDYSEEKKRMVYKIIDFGFSRRMPEGQQEKVIEGRSYGTFPYKAPEVWRQSIHGYTADIWCLGIMTLFMSNGSNDFFYKKEGRKMENTKNYTKFREFIDGTLEHPFKNPEASPEIIHFILSAMDRDRTKRWTAPMLLEHPFVTGQGLGKEQLREIRGKRGV